MTVDLALGKAVLSAAGKPIYALLKERTAAAQHETVWAELKDEVLFEAAEGLGKVQKDVNALRARVESKDFHRALNGALLEGLHSTNEERIKLLGAALAGFVASEIPAEVRSRAYRIALQLEPSDVVHLRQLHDAAIAQRDDPDGKHLLRAQTTNSLSAEALQALGCASTTSPWTVGDDEHQYLTFVSPLGTTVLELLETYRPNAMCDRPV